MKDNIRENLFNILGRAVRGAVCFDLFAGTGALAFESLSRGATSARVVEQNRHAIEVIRKTTNRLGLEHRMEILSGDAFKIAGRLLMPPPNDTPWIVFVCPPYVLWEESLEGLRAIIQSTLDHAPPGSVLVAALMRRRIRERSGRYENVCEEHSQVRILSGARCRVFGCGGAGSRGA